MSNLDVGPYTFGFLSWPTAISFPHGFGLIWVPAVSPPADPFFVTVLQIDGVDIGAPDNFSLIKGITPTEPVGDITGSYYAGRSFVTPAGFFSNYLVGNYYVFKLPPAGATFQLNITGAETGQSTDIMIYAGILSAIPFGSFDTLGPAPLGPGELLTLNFTGGQALYGGPGGENTLSGSAVKVNDVQSAGTDVPNIVQFITSPTKSILINGA